MATGGGVAPARDAAARPIRLLESGPAAGALAAARFAAFNGVTETLQVRPLSVDRKTRALSPPPVPNQASEAPRTNRHVPLAAKAPSPVRRRVTSTTDRAPISPSEAAIWIQLV